MARPPDPRYRHLGARLPLELVERLQHALEPRGVLGRHGCTRKTAAVERALRELLDRLEAEQPAS